MTGRAGTVQAPCFFVLEVPVCAGLWDVFLVGGVQSVMGSDNQECQ